MILREVIEGVGLDTWGAAFYALSRWQVRSDSRMRRMAQSRWWLDRRTVLKVRHSEVTQEEWFTKFAATQRQIVRWVFTPVVVLWVILCTSLIIHGLTSPG